MMTLRVSDDRHSDERENDADEVNESLMTLIIIIVCQLYGSLNNFMHFFQSFKIY
jgi:hypothetical protein